jgi:hypothetical protein
LRAQAFAVVVNFDLYRVAHRASRIAKAATWLYGRSGRGHSSAGHKGLSISCLTKVKVLNGYDDPGGHRHGLRASELVALR